MEISFSKDEMLLGIDLCNYEDEFGCEGSMLRFGFLLVTLTIYF